MTESDKAREAGGATPVDVTIIVERLHRMKPSALVLTVDLLVACFGISLVLLYMVDSEDRGRFPGFATIPLIVLVAWSGFIRFCDHLRLRSSINQLLRDCVRNGTCATKP
jgi:hypothetical protein